MESHKFWYMVISIFITFKILANFPFDFFFDHGLFRRALLGFQILWDFFKDFPVTDFNLILLWSENILGMT